jgi:hypothetical protein
VAIKMIKMIRNWPLVAYAKPVRPRVKIQAPENIESLSNPLIKLEVGHVLGKPSGGVVD